MPGRAHATATIMSQAEQIHVTLTLTHDEFARVVEAWSASMMANGQASGLSGFLRAVLSCTTQARLRAIERPQAVEAATRRVDLCLDAELYNKLLRLKRRHRETASTVMLSAVLAQAERLTLTGKR